jgi:hypothetical protein
MAEQRALVLIDGQIQELPIGDTLAGASGGAPIPSAGLVGAKALLTTDLNIPGFFDTLVTFGSTEFDTSSFFSAGQPTRLTIPADVTYVEILASFSARTLQSNSTDYIVRFLKNGVVFQTYTIDNQFWGPPPIHSGVLPVVAGDYIEVQVWCTEEWELSSTTSFVTIKSATGIQGIQGEQGVAGSTMVQTEITTTTYSTVNGDFSGNVIRRMNNGSTQTITIEPSMTGGQPVTFIRVGAGAVTFAVGAGVTIHSAGSNLSIADRYGSATLIPDTTTADTYYLIGNLTT